MSEIERLMLDGLLTPVSHYCHAVRAGDRVWVSGMVGIAADGSIPDSVEEQFDLALGAMDAALRAAGSGPEGVVKVTVFLTDIADRPRINPRRIEYFGDHRPASTLVEVSALVRPELKVEIEAEAVTS